MPPEASLFPAGCYSLCFGLHGLPGPTPASGAADTLVEIREEEGREGRLR